VDERRFGNTSTSADDFEVGIAMKADMSHRLDMGRGMSDMSGIVGIFLEGILEIEHDRLWPALHIVLGVHPQEGHFFFDMKRQAVMVFFIVNKIRLHDVPRRVKVGLFYFRTFGRVETIMKGDFANLVEVLMIDVRAFLARAVWI
jgi:hypothetical protein